MLKAYLLTAVYVLLSVNAKPLDQQMSNSIEQLFYLADLQQPESNSLFPETKPRAEVNFAQEMIQILNDQLITDQMTLNQAKDELDELVRLTAADDEVHADDKADWLLEFYKYHVQLDKLQMAEKSNPQDGPQRSRAGRWLSEVDVAKGLEQLEAIEKEIDALKFDDILTEFEKDQANEPTPSTPAVIHVTTAKAEN